MATLAEIIKNRLKKRKILLERQENPYPVFTKRTHEIGAAFDNFSALSKGKKVVKLAGRLMALRIHGGMTFGEIKDSSGEIQIAFRQDVLGKIMYGRISKYLDIGDFLNVEGILFKTKKGERTLDVKKFKLLSKSIRPLPEKWHGLKDVEQRYRKRYLDILMNDEVGRIFETRFKIIQETRNFMNSQGFREVETPILQFIAGGATAKPFKTHLNALNLDMYMRISLELYLKRLLVAGYDKVYEIGRNFRNEGLDYSHNPEFTMLEFYWAYSDYKEGMKFTEKLFSHILKNTINSKKIEYEGNTIDFSVQYKRIEFEDLLFKYTKINYSDFNLETLKAKAKELGVNIEKDIYSKAEAIDYIFKKLCIPKLINPTFIIHYPSEMLPLAKPLPDNPRFAASFQLVVAGLEMVKAYSELNDPVVQRKFFEEQEKLRKKGDTEAQVLDEEFIEALEYGMPPAFGFGLGMDRLTAVLTGVHSLREVILFPTMKPK